MIAALLSLAIACGPADPSTTDAALADGGVDRALRVRGVMPLRGPFTGGTRLVVEGSGFTPDRTRVRVGELDVPGVRVHSSSRISLVTPSHAPGTVSVTVSIDGREATLDDAFTYDALAVDPPLAPMAGGHRVTIHGSSTDFREGDEFHFGGAACGELRIASTIEASCRVPSSDLEGFVDVEQKRAGSALTSAPEAFEYVSEPLTFGGVTGEPIDGVIDVHVIGWVGPIEDAVVVVEDPPLRARTDAAGHVRIEAPDLEGPIVLHVGHRCYARTSFAGLDASEIVVPLVQHPGGTDCPRSPPIGGPGAAEGEVYGRIVFVEGAEFPAPTPRWVGVPEPREHEMRFGFVGYGTPFYGTEYSAAEGGIPFHYTLVAGTHRACAVAGIAPDDLIVEAPAGFRPFIAGCARSVLVPPHGVVRDVVIEMDIPTTSRFEIDVDPLPALDIAHGISATELRRALAPSADVGVYSDRGPPGADTWRSRSESTPFVATMTRIPVAPDWLVYLGAAWGGRGTPGSSIQLFDPSPGAPLRLTPLGVPRFSSPEPAGRIRRGESIRFAIDGPASTDLVRLLVRSSSGLVADWYVFARGDHREITLPSHDDPELALPIDNYELTLGAEERPGFDFDSFAFRTLNLETAWHRASGNTIYARIDPEAP